MANEATSFSESSRTVFGDKTVIFGTLTTYNGSGTAALELDLFREVDFLNLTPTNTAADDYGLSVGETFPRLGALTLTPTVADQTYVVMLIGTL